MMEQEMTDNAARPPDGDMLTITRESLGELLGLLDTVENALGPAPHATALAILRATGEARDILEEVLPDGYFGRCELCGSLVGGDEPFSSSEDGTVCGPCCDRYADAPVGAEE